MPPNSAPQKALPPIDPEHAALVTRTVMQEMDQAAKHLITQKDAKNYTTKERQKTTVAFLSTLLNQTQYRERYVEWALNNPGKAMEHAIATLPKEINVENHTYLDGLTVLQPTALDAWIEMARHSDKPTLTVEPIE